MQDAFPLENLMTVILPTHRDIAEFFRLGLLAGVCDLSAVVCWADSVLTSDSSPLFAFCDLSICESQPISSVVSLLREVPGSLTPDLPALMLLGYCHQLSQSGSLALTETLTRLHHMARTEHFPDRIDSALANLDEDFYLAREGIHGTVTEMERAFTDYLARYRSYAPDNLSVPKISPK